MTRHTTPAQRAATTRRRVNIAARRAERDHADAWAAYEHDNAAAARQLREEAYDMTDEMKSSWLVQRLDKPTTGRSVLGADNPFAFGGGLRNGGLSDEAMGLLREVFSFDYMGAAEFEFGAVPEALDGMAKDHHLLTSDRAEVDLTTLAPDFRDKTTYTGTAPVYVIARKAHVEEAKRRICEWAERGYSSRLKEATHLDMALRPGRPDWHRTEGWLELDNGFFFFTSETMFRGVADLFGVDAEVLS